MLTPQTQSNRLSISAVDQHDRPPSFRETADSVSRADYEAVLNDLEQAQFLAAEYQREISSRSNSFADLRRMFEKTSAQLVSALGAVEVLRKEKRKLVDEVARVAAIEFRLQRVTEEKDRLAGEVRALRQRPEVEAPKPILESEEFTDFMTSVVDFPSFASRDSEVVPQAITQADRILAHLVASLDDLRQLVEPEPAPESPAGLSRPRSEMPGIIEVSFSR